MSLRPTERGGVPVRLRLEFPDKYRLWAELVKANTDRVFIEAPTVPPKLGHRVPVELMVGGVLLVAFADVVAVRPPGGRFRPGVWVRLADEEVDKVRRFLGLAQEPPPDSDTGRESRREPCNLKAVLTRPPLPDVSQLRNLSETGALLESTAPLVSGQQVELEVTLDDGTRLPLTAAVTREGPEMAFSGLRFVDLDGERQAALKAQVERLVARPPRARQLVVVADDEPDILDFLTRALSKHGFQVLKATGGREAMALIRQTRPQLVLLDILMPGMDGVDVCKAMRGDIELSQVPVIFASALDESRLHAVADEAGATDYLSKPLLLGDLLNMVGTYLKEV
jgi:CheY-like chemotaxis protein